MKRPIPDDVSDVEEQTEELIEKLNKLCSGYRTDSVISAFVNVIVTDAYRRSVKLTTINNILTGLVNTYQRIVYGDENEKS